MMATATSPGFEERESGMERLQDYVVAMAREAQKAAVSLRSLNTERKNAALLFMGKAIGESRGKIREANALDVERGRKAGLSSALLDRLSLNDKRIDELIASLSEIAGFEDPVGEVIGVRRPSGFLLEKVRTPIGVIAIIYESRPNVTVDAAALCLKSGNAAILRGGSEALESSRALVAAIRQGLASAGIDGNAVSYVDRSEYEAIDILVAQSGLVDLVIPRGGEALIRRVVEKATVPVIKHYKGVCHLYVDETADLAVAAELVFNSKVQRPGTCNALEKLLVHRDVASTFLPMARAKMQNVELRGDETARAILPGIGKASEEDWYAEYLDLVLAVRVVGGLEEAAVHIEKYGSRHTDGIVSRSAENIERFVGLVDSAVVTVNASTRLSDGGIFGLGAEIGISTDKLHARGPMGLKELTTYKWVVRGKGDLRK
jgi:glutamate-5-semialdehyde dehydrogenase